VGALLSVAAACAQDVGVAQTLASPATTKPTYYPAGNQMPLRVGEEGYQDAAISLRGLTGVFVNLDDILAGAQSRNVKLPPTFKADVVKRLNNAGIRVLTKDELARTPGQPELNMYLSYPRHLNPPTKNEPAPPYRPDCCLATIWTSFSQGSSTLRDPLSPIKQSTWGEGHNTSDCSDLGAWFTGVVFKTLDNFIAAKAKGEREGAARKMAPLPQAPTPAASGNMECNTSLMLYIEMFSTGSSKILPSKFFVLNKLAEAIKSCPAFNYVIETHADHRSDASFNEKLTKDRASAIRQFLLSKGVDETRFELQWFGESKPITEGVKAEDFAANRRVVVTPFRVMAKN
jgi:outer membrane protein OmpA-like peptidoglycan-associated protein